MADYQQVVLPQHWPTHTHTCVPPAGLSAERQHYIFEKIRKFCPEHVHDLVCPNPDESTRTELQGERYLFSTFHLHRSQGFAQTGKAQDRIKEPAQSWTNNSSKLIAMSFLSTLIHPHAWIFAFFVRVCHLQISSDRVLADWLHHLVVFMTLAIPAMFLDTLAASYPSTTHQLSSQMLFQNENGQRLTPHSTHVCIYYA